MLALAILGESKSMHVLLKICKCYIMFNIVVMPNLNSFYFFGGGGGEGNTILGEAKAIPCMQS